MTVSYSPISFTDIAVGAADNASTFNSPMAEIKNGLIQGLKDAYIRHIPISIAAGESITAGDAVRLSGATILKCDSGSDAGITGFIGFALETKTVGQATMVSRNAVYGLSGLTAGAVYYLGTSGGITATKPTVRAFVVGIAISTTDLIISPVLVDSNNFSGQVGVGANGTNGGNGQQQASIAIPTGAKMGLIYVTGDYYNGVAGTHTGYWHGMWRSSSNAITALSDVENDTGTNQGFTVSYSAGSIVVANKSGMTANQSGVTKILFM